MYVKIDGFKPDPTQCGVYTGVVYFVDAATHETWYKGELKFSIRRREGLTERSPVQKKCLRYMVRIVTVDLTSLFLLYGISDTPFYLVELPWVRMKFFVKNDNPYSF